MGVSHALNSMVGEDRLEGTEESRLADATGSEALSRAAETGVPSGSGVDSQIVNLRYNGHTLSCFTEESYVYYATLVAGQYNFLKVREGDTVVDAGANVGDFTILAAERVGPAGVVLAIEPNPDSFRLLLRNVKENGLTNVICENIALSSGAGVAQLVDRGHSSFLGTAPESVSLTVAADTLDNLLSRHGISHVNVLKMDIEGAEGAALERQSFLRAVETLAVELHGSENLRQVPELLLTQGFSIRWFNEADLVAGVIKTILTRPLDFIQAEVATGTAWKALIAFLLNRQSPAPAFIPEKRMGLLYAWKARRGP